MTRKAVHTRISSIGKRGKATELKAELLEFDFGNGRRVGVYLADGGGQGLEIVLLGDEPDALLRVESHADAAVNVRLVPRDVEAGPVAKKRTRRAAKREPLLNLKIQKALSGDDRDLAPRKHRIRTWARAALRAGVADVTIRLVDEAEGRALNHDYRGKDYATNVLTFVYDAIAASGKTKQDDLFSGDLVVCVPVLAREAAEQGKPLEAHFAHLVVHGMLHLQGYDHESPEQAAIMEPLEAEILATLGFGDPYA